MSYEKLFDPQTTPEPGSGQYVYNDEIVLAVNVALATGRPLLLRGAPGCGKSTLAGDIARQMKRIYYEDVVTSRSEARDLLWSFDAVRRLNDRTASAQLSGYVRPCALWKAYDPTSAAEHDPKLVDDGRRGAVVLLDEIDKAEPDVPNDLLVPLGARLDEIAFKVQETDFQVRVRRKVLVVITTNEERDLPTAFMRRCIVLVLERPAGAACLPFARAHFTVDQIGDVDLLAIAERLDQLAGIAADRNLRQPGTAEYLDAVRAIVGLKQTADPVERERIVDRALWKHKDRPEGQPSQ
jgi:MoxR-like ATPase